MEGPTLSFLRAAVVLSLAIGSVVPAAAEPGPILSAVLPASRSVEVGGTATAFATIINAGSDAATGCFIEPTMSVPGTFVYQTTDPATNALTGTPDTPATIPPGSLQTFLIAITTNAPFSPTDIEFNMDCSNTAPAQIVRGLNSLLLSVAADSTPDVIALATTPTLDGIVQLDDAGAFSIATVNVGVEASITATASYGGTGSPVSLSICETNPANGLCNGPLVPASTGVNTFVANNATPTFSVFGTALEDIPLDPASRRIFVEFRDSTNALRGSTSVAVEGLAAGSAAVDVTGVYQGTTNETLANCEDAETNGNYSFPTTVNISSQVGNAWSATLSGQTTVQGANVQLDGTIDGTVDENGALTGTLSTTLRVNGAFDSSSTGTGSGTLNGNTLSFSFSGQDVAGDICTFEGNFTGNR